MSPSKVRLAFVIAAAMLLTGCFDKATALVWFPHSQLVTIADVDLLSGQDDESPVVARLAKGTVVTPIGQSGSHCNSWCGSTRPTVSAGSIPATSRRCRRRSER